MSGILERPTYPPARVVRGLEDVCAAIAAPLDAVATMLVRSNTVSMTGDVSDIVNVCVAVAPVAEHLPGCGVCDTIEVATEAVDRLAKSMVSSVNCVVGTSLARASSIAILAHTRDAVYIEAKPAFL